MSELPVTFLDMMPLPILIAKQIDNELNNPVEFVNSEFLQQIGWTINDIPDKNAWWSKAYPDSKYQQAVENQWELALEEAVENGKGFVLLDVNVNTKSNGTKRFRVYTEINNILIPGYLIVAFEPIANK